MDRSPHLEQAVQQIFSPKVKALDLSDPEIWQMAYRHHVPGETWTASGHLIGVFCEQCGQDWPCGTKQALNASPLLPGPAPEL